jgi:predicted dehydrogenase
LLRIGIIGCGRATTMFHLKALENLDEIEVVAVADKDVSRARGVAEEIGAMWYESHRELLSDDEVEAVVVNTPPAFHEEMTLEALRAGKHVLCEKPVARSIEGCRGIASEAERRGLIAHPFHNYVHTPILDEALRLLKVREIGNVERVSVKLMNNLRGYRPKTSFRFEGDHGILEDLLPHIFSVVGLIAGWSFKVLEVEGWRRRYPVVDNLLFRLQVDGVPIEGEASWTALIPSFKIYVEGSEASLKMELMKRPWSLELKRGGKLRKIGGGGLGLYLGLLKMRHPSFKRQYQHFYRVVMGLEKPRLTMREEEVMVSVLSEVMEVMRVHG